MVENKKYASDRHFIFECGFRLHIWKYSMDMFVFFFIHKGLPLPHHLCLWYGDCYCMNFHLIAGYWVLSLKFQIYTHMSFRKYMCMFWITMQLLRYSIFLYSQSQLREVGWNSKFSINIGIGIPNYMFKFSFSHAVPFCKISTMEKFQFAT